MDTERFNRAISLLESGEFDWALREFNVLAELSIDTEEKGSILLNQVNCLTRLGRVEEARERWVEAAAHWRSFYTDYVDICLCLTESRADDALVKLADFLTRRDELMRSGDQDLYSDAAERLAGLLFERGRYDSAIEPFRSALQAPGAEARKSKLLLYLAICYIQTEDLEGADLIFKESLSLDREDELWPTVQYQLGRLHFKKGAYAEARKAFELCQSSTSEEDVQKSASLWLERVNALVSQGAQRII